MLFWHDSDSWRDAPACRPREVEPRDGGRAVPGISQPSRCRDCTSLAGDDLPLRGRVPPRPAQGPLDVACKELAATASERTADAAQATTGDVLPKGKVNQDTLESAVGQIAEPQATRAAESAGSPRQQRYLDALARRRPDLLAKVRARKMSCHAACVQAGITKVPPLLEIGKRAAARRARCPYRRSVRWRANTFFSISLSTLPRQPRV
jgi:hypothetical protein